MHADSRYCDFPLDAIFARHFAARLHSRDVLSPLFSSRRHFHAAAPADALRGFRSSFISQPQAVLQPAFSPACRCMSCHFSFGIFRGAPPPVFDTASSPSLALPFQQLMPDCRRARPPVCATSRLLFTQFQKGAATFFRQLSAFFFLR